MIGHELGAHSAEVLHSTTWATWATTTTLSKRSILLTSSGETEVEHLPRNQEVVDSNSAFL